MNKRMNKSEIDDMIHNERIREHAQEHKEACFDTWFDEQWSNAGILEDFIKDGGFEDDFREYAREVYCTEME